jgi:hypothetical protein
MIPRKIWLCAQRYGRSMPEDTFAGYLFWATPIARRISFSSGFARVAAVFLMPAVYEMAVVMGDRSIKSTFSGRVMIKVCYTVSFVLGKMVRPKRGMNVARA